MDSVYYDLEAKEKEELLTTIRTWNTILKIDVFI